MTELVMAGVDLVAQGQEMSEMIEMIRRSADLDDLTEARARIKARRAWAEVHGKAKEMRLQLLAVEVEALVRIVDLDGLETLPKKEQRAALWLAKMTTQERAKLLAESGTSTTAVGMCDTIFRQEDYLKKLDQQRQQGRDFASGPGRNDMTNNDRIASSANRAQDLDGVLHNVLEKIVRQGMEFTVPEMAEEIIEQCGIDPELAGEAFQEGVEEVLRTALRSGPMITIEGTPIPRVITVLRDKGYVRIPTENATLAHLDDMVLMRREQANRYSEAVDRLEKAADRLRQVAAGNTSSRIGDLLSQMVVSTN
jgi:hypothetical protein